MKKKFVWLSYDLSITGDYTNLYQWLDLHDAKECGDSVACFWYEFENYLKHEIEHDLQKHIQIDDRKDRFYLISPKKENDVLDKYFGTFLFGRRKASPWEGYAAKENEQDDEY